MQVNFAYLWSSCDISPIVNEVPEVSDSEGQVEVNAGCRGVADVIKHAN